MKTPIFIIGYMACGKTTFGKALARKSGKEFIDLDFYIEQRFRKSITELFKEKGEEGFRKIESSMLRESGEFEDVVIACGGGTACFNGNMEYMLGAGSVIFLEASVDRMLRRLTVNNSRRPLMAGKSVEEMRETIEKGLSERLPYYMRAHIRHSGEELEDRCQIASAVERFMEAHPEVSGRQ